MKDFSALAAFALGCCVLVMSLAYALSVWAEVVEAITEVVPK